MKELTYSLALNIAYKKISNVSFFALSLQRSSEDFFLSKKILKKTNIISSELFIHHPIYLRAFTTYEALTSYLTKLTIETKHLIEYVKCDYLKFYTCIQLFILFSTSIILKNLPFIFQNLEMFSFTYFFLKKNNNHLVH